MKTTLFMLLFAFVQPFASANAQTDKLRETVDRFIAERCDSWELLSESSTETPRDLGQGRADYIYHVNLVINRMGPENPSIQEEVVIKVVNRWEGDWFVFDGHGNACDFKNLEYYSE